MTFRRLFALGALALTFLAIAYAAGATVSGPQPLTPRLATRNTPGI